MADFCTHTRIYYHDTDAGGVVYYAAYFEHLEEGRYEFCRAKGVDLGAYAKEGIAFPAVHVEIDYKSPARYGDSITIVTRIEKIGNSSIHFFQEINKDTTILVKAKTVWACIGKDFLAQPVPKSIKEALSSDLPSGTKRA